MTERLDGFEAAFASMAELITTEWREHDEQMAAMRQRAESTLKNIVISWQRSV